VSPQVVSVPDTHATAVPAATFRGQAVTEFEVQFQTPAAEQVQSYVAVPNVAIVVSNVQVDPVPEHGKLIGLPRTRALHC